jgi:hypothetical protein
MLELSIVTPLGLHIVHLVYLTNTFIENNQTPNTTDIHKYLSRDRNKL